jgi:D-sedoheptulose 7-phosphate isomerase
MDCFNVENSMRKIIENSLSEAVKTLQDFVSDSTALDALECAGNIMAESILNGGKIIACGNGGSLCDATHFAEELTSRFRKDRFSIPAIAINDPAYITCTINDFSPDILFSRYVESFAKSGDVLLAISTSGNSENVLNASKVAKERGMKVVALTGKGGGKLANLADVEIRAPHTPYSDRAQEIHIKAIHILVECIEAKVVYKTV